jgi:hypothetical protein
MPFYVKVTAKITHEIRTKNIEILWFDELYVLLEGLEASLGS